MMKIFSKHWNQTSSLFIELHLSIQAILLSHSRGYTDSFIYRAMMSQSIYLLDGNI